MQIAKEVHCPSRQETPLPLYQLSDIQSTAIPPGEPWGGAPVGDGIWYIVGAAGLYLLVKTRKRNATGIASIPADTFSILK